MIVYNNKIIQCNNNKLISPNSEKSQLTYFPQCSIEENKQIEDLFKIWNDKKSQNLLDFNISFQILQFIKNNIHLAYDTFIDKIEPFTTDITKTQLIELLGAESEKDLEDNLNLIAQSENPKIKSIAEDSYELLGKNLEHLNFPNITKLLRKYHSGVCFENMSFFDSIKFLNDIRSLSNKQERLFFSLKEEYWTKKKIKEKDFSWFNAVFENQYTYERIVKCIENGLFTAEQIRASLSDWVLAVFSDENIYDRIVKCIEDGLFTREDIMKMQLTTVDSIFGSDIAFKNICLSIKKGLFTPGQIVKMNQYNITIILDHLADKAIQNV